jgi:peptide/nickel transport system ATP-binding protein
LPTKPDTPAKPDAPGQPLVQVRGLHVDFALRANAVARLIGGAASMVHAVDGVDLELAPGEVLGLVGESGSGKSTLGRALLGLVRPSGGSVTYRGRELVGLSESKLRPLRRKLQMVFQDPHASLNPSMTIGRAIGDALRIHHMHPGREAREQAVRDALERVGLAPAARFVDKFPGELSGGQKQRAVIARAIVLGPELLVADEPISMLDMSVRAKILGLLDELRRDLGLTYVYITHDLASARFFCDRIAIMYLGKIVETGPTEEIFSAPRHPYTKALLDAVPDPDPSRSIPRELPRGEVPDAADPPAGCPFHPRCPRSFAPCGWQPRDLRMIFEQRWTGVDAEQYAAEAKLTADGAIFDAADATTTGTDTTATVHPATGGPGELLTLLQAERDAHPDEGLWHGITDMSVHEGAVRIEFVPRATPRLLPVLDSAVQVSCHLYHDPDTTPAPR